MEKDNPGVSRWFAGLYCMPVIFRLSASAKPRGRKRRELRRREPTPVGNYLSRGPGQRAPRKEPFSWSKPRLRLQVTAGAFDARLAKAQDPADRPLGSFGPKTKAKSELGRCISD